MEKQYGEYSEDQLQVQMVTWFNKEFPEYRGRLFHVPNGGNRNSMEAMKFKAMGVQPGVSDLCLLLLRTVAWIEVKTAKGTQSVVQQEFEARVVFLGMGYYIVRNLEQFKSVIWSHIGKL